MRTWTRVLALLALVIALAGGAISGGAPYHGPPRHDVEARQSIHSPDSARGGQPNGHLARKLVNRHFWEQEVASSRTLHVFQTVLQVKAQPPPPSSKCLALTLQLYPLAYSLQISLAAIS